MVPSIVMYMSSFANSSTCIPLAPVKSQGQNTVKVSKRIVLGSRKTNVKRNL